MKIKCPGCANVLNIPETAAGKVVKCPCGKQLRAPGGATSGAVSGSPRPVAGAVTATAATRQVPKPAPVVNPSMGGFGDIDAALFDELTDEDLKPVRSVVRPGVAPMVSSSSASGSKLLQQHANSRDPREQLLLGPQINAELASVSSRILGRIIDNVFYSIGIGIAIVMYITFVAVSLSDEETELSETGWGTMFYVCVFVWFLPQLINAVLISMSGQTIGKKIMKIKVISETTGAPPGFLQGFWRRTWQFGGFCGIPILGQILFFADVYYLFQDDRETLHDKWAKTMVVVA